MNACFVCLLVRKVTTKTCGDPLNRFFFPRPLWTSATVQPLAGVGGYQRIESSAYTSFAWTFRPKDLPYVTIYADLMALLSPNSLHNVFVRNLIDIVGKVLISRVPAKGKPNLVLQYIPALSTTRGRARRVDMKPGG